MNSLTIQINKILQQEDIEGLIEAGAPYDEYTSEAEAIAAILSKEQGPDFTKLTNIIFEFWQNVFNLSDSDMNLRKDAIHRVSTNIGNHLE